MSMVKSRELWIGIALAIAFVFAYVKTEPVAAEEQVAPTRWGCGHNKRCWYDDVAGYRWHQKRWDNLEPEIV